MMRCPHTETTAILAAFGEAPADFGDHLDSCAECRQVVDMHTETLTVLENAQPARSATPRRWPSWTAGLLLAAAALLAVSTFNIGADPDRNAVDSPVPTPRLVHAGTPLPFQSNLDSALSDLEMELALLDME
jgi:hypothetical protein